MHYHYITDAHGDIVEAVAFCSDSCHREWCRENDQEYGGWNGCHEGGDYPEFCAQCGVYAGGTPQCDCQANNVVVNRFPSAQGEKCEHGNWIQLPEES